MPPVSFIRHYLQREDAQENISRRSEHIRRAARRLTLAPTNPNVQVRRAPLEITRSSILHGENNNPIHHVSPLDGLVFDSTSIGQEHDLDGISAPLINIDNIMSPRGLETYRLRA